MGLTGRRRGALAAAARGMGAAAVILALAGCEGRGIFYTLATEARRDNGNLNDELTATAVVRAGGHFYLAAGGAWRTVDRDENRDWQPVARPRSGGEELLVLGLAAAGNDLCAGTERGLFRAAAAASPDWKQVAGVDAGEQVQRVFAVPRSPDGKLLAITITTLGEAQHTYRVYASDADCRSFSPVEGMQDTASRPVDAAYAFGAYWMTAGAKLYRGETLEELVEHEEQPEGGGGSYEGVFLNAARDRLYVAGGNGLVHFTTDGNTWTKGEIERQPQPSAADDSALALTAFTQIDRTILVGTRDHGFYRFEDGSSPDDATRGPRLTSQLYEAHVTGFARFGNIVFAATAGDGLSSIDLSKAGGRLEIWNWE